MLCHVKRFHTFGHMKAIYIKDHGSFFCGRSYFHDHLQEKAKFQGVGDCEFEKYKMQDLTDKQLSDLAGNSFLGRLNEVTTKGIW